MENFNSNAPCSRVVNGFRISSVESSSGFYWKIIPNSSTRSFCFAKLSCAEDFCHNYENYHSEAFWYRLWLKNPIYHLTNVEKIANNILYLL